MCVFVFVCFINFFQHAPHHRVPIFPFPFIYPFILVFEFCYSLFTLFFVHLVVKHGHNHIFIYIICNMYVCIYGEYTRDAHIGMCIVHTHKHTKKTWMLFTLKPNVNRNNALNSQHPFGIQIEFRIYSIYVFKLILLFVARTHSSICDVSLYILFCSVLFFPILLLLFSLHLEINRDIYWNFDRQFICNINAQCVITHTV